MLTKRISKRRRKTRLRNKTQDGLRNLVGARIRELRRKARPKITQDDLAGRVASMGISLDRTAVYRIETGARAITDMELTAISRALRVEISELFAK